MGGGRSCPICRRISWNNSLGTATSAIWNVTYRAWVTILAPRFAESDDPGRLVPVLHDPDELQIVVCGAANRNRSFIAGQFGSYGGAVSKEIRRPAK